MSPKLVRLPVLARPPAVAGVINRSYEAERDRLAGQLETSSTERAEVREQARSWQEYDASTRAELAAARRAVETAAANLADWRAHYEAQLAEAHRHRGPGGGHE